MRCVRAAIVYQVGHFCFGDVGQYYFGANSQMHYFERIRQCVGPG